MAGEIFISYRRSDLAYAKRLCDLLKVEGCDAWYDALVGAGQDWRAATAAALTHSRIFVLLFSKAASESDDIAKELAAATFSKKLVVPVRMENIQPEGAFLYELASRNWIDAYEETDARLAELAKNLGGVVKEGVSTESVVNFERGRIAPRRSPRWRRLALMGLGVVAAGSVGAVGISLFSGGGNSAAPPTQTAVFGFSASGDAPAAGIAAAANDETVATLTAMSLRTIAPGETIGVKPAERLEKARALSARYAVSGDVMADGSQITISVRIEDVPSGTALWSQTLRGSTTEPLGVQAAALATDTLSCFIQRMSGREGRTAELGVLVGRQCRDMRSTSIDIVATSRDLARRIPDSATIQGTLALEVLLTVGQAPQSARAALIAEGRAATLEGLRLDPIDPWPHLANYQLQVARNETLATREAALKHGLNLVPSDATLNMFYGNFLHNVGMTAKAFPHLALGVSNDPLSAPKRLGYAQALALAGHTTEAETHTARAIQLMASPEVGWQFQIRFALMNGVGDAQKLFDNPPAQVSPAIIRCWRDIAAGLKARDTSARNRASLRTKACADEGAVAPESALGAAVALGDLHTAFALAAKLSVSTPGYAFLFAPETAAMRRDPQFMPLVEAGGLVAYWRETGTQPDFCATEKAPVCAALAAR